MIDSVEKVSVKTATYHLGQDELLFLRPAAGGPEDQRPPCARRRKKVADLYAKFGRLDAAVNQVVSPAVNQQVKVVFGRYTPQ